MQVKKQFNFYVIFKYFVHFGKKIQTFLIIYKLFSYNLAKIIIVYFGILFSNNLQTYFYLNKKINLCIYKLYLYNFRISLHFILNNLTKYVYYFQKYT